MARKLDDCIASLPATLLIALLGMLAAPLARSAEDGAAAAAPSITVSGSGEVVVDPDRATLTIAVESQGATSAAAAADNAHLAAAVTDALLAAGAAHSDLVTANYMVQPQWQYSSNAAPKRTGYNAYKSLRISVTQLAVLGKWIDAALGAGAARVESIQFESGQATRARREALAQAVANAKADADVLAKAAGGTLGALQELSTVSSAGPRVPLPVANLSMAARQAEETQIEPSPLHISAVVTGRWLFQP